MHYGETSWRNDVEKRHRETEKFRRETSNQFYRVNNNIKLIMAKRHGE